jgi:hypothetical protein
MAFISEKEISNSHVIRLKPTVHCTLVHNGTVFGPSEPIGALAGNLAQT